MLIFPHGPTFPLAFLKHALVDPARAELPFLLLPTEQGDGSAIMKATLLGASIPGYGLP